MSINHVYASFFDSCGECLCVAAKHLFQSRGTLVREKAHGFVRASTQIRVETRDIALIASTVLAVILTRPVLSDETSKGIHQGRLMEILSMAEAEV
jgi:hypothetical protein